MVVSTSSTTDAAVPEPLPVPESFPVPEPVEGTAEEIWKWVDALEDKVIKEDDPESKSRKYASYIPFWA